MNNDIVNKVIKTHLNINKVDKIDKFNLNNLNEPN